MSARPPALARLFEEVHQLVGRRDVLELADAARELDALLEPELVAGWVLEERELSNGARIRVTVYRVTYRLAGHEWTGESVVPPDLDPATLDDVSIRRLQQGATLQLRRELVPDGAALRAAEVSGRPR